MTITLFVEPELIDVFIEVVKEIETIMDSGFYAVDYEPPHRHLRFGYSTSQRDRWVAFNIDIRYYLKIKQFYPNKS